MAYVMLLDKIAFHTYGEIEIREVMTRSDKMESMRSASMPRFVGLCLRTGR